MAKKKEGAITIHAPKEVKLVGCVCKNAYTDGQLGRTVKVGEKLSVTERRYDELKKLGLVL